MDRRGLAAVGAALCLTVVAVAAGWTPTVPPAPSSGDPAATGAASSTSRSAGAQPQDESDNGSSQPADSAGNGSAPAGEEEGNSSSKTSVGPEPLLVRPGLELGSGCTLGFLARNATGAWYGFTAGHCVGDDRQPVTANHNGTAVRIGRIVAYEEPGHRDWALIRFVQDPERVVFEPAVRNWTGPTGPWMDPVAFNDVVCAYGNGLAPLKSWVYDTGQARCGRFDEWGDGDAVPSEQDGWFTAKMRTEQGDSGGPVIHHPTGRAVGIIAAQEIHGVDGFHRRPFLGQTACALLFHAHRSGYPLTLATAPYDPQPPRDEGPPILVQEPEAREPADPMCDELREIRSG